MITRIREVRRARGMTLDDVAKACDPPTTPQTIGRLETGTRTVSIGWLNRIASALGVEAQDLVQGGEDSDLKVAATLGPHGAIAPRRSAVVVAPRFRPGQVAITVSASVGDYRAGDEIWCDVLEPNEFGQGLNRDVLVPRPAGRFLFGRMLDRADDRVQLLPLASGGRQQVIANAPWIAVTSKLIRSF
jgi:transcriptional regulator with XRE-family HTH domain